ncbi:MAG: [protein-PII] uridylyltransferase, partial [Pseudomonadota bacterium]
MHPPSPAPINAILEGQLDGFNLKDPLATAKSALQTVDAELNECFKSGTDIPLLLQARTRAVDTVLMALWDTCHWNQDSTLSLVAMGGYGRGELHPHSDIDLMILCKDNPERDREALEYFIAGLWDIGLQLGHSVRTVDSCLDEARADITVVTNLMEARILRGSSILMEHVKQGIVPSMMWSPEAFFHAKLDEQNRRHEKFADTEYNLEPNVKSSPGGLRDFQIICWIIERYFGVTAQEALSVEALLKPDEKSLLEEGRNFMWRVRYALHMLSGRTEDRLLFDYQRQIADLWGFNDDDERLAVERFMQLYYSWALTLGQLNDVLIQFFAQRLVTGGNAEVEPVNERFTKQNGYIDAVREDLFRTNPSSILEVFLLCAQREDIVDIGARTLRAIYDCQDLIDDEFRNDPNNQALFIEFLQSPHQITRMLRRMTRYGFLGNYIPAFGKIIGQMQHDLFHVYTVDAHTLELIQNIRRFMTGNYEEKFPVSSRVARRLPKKELIYIAGLFHDIGKGRGGDHSELGAVDAEQFCRQHSLSDRDTSIVTWLVKNHLLMSAVSQRKDISDPDVIQQFAAHAGDQQRLDYLFTLTVADINATNPNLWNAWRSSLLRQLYTEATRALRRGLENPVDKQQWIEETRHLAIKALEYRGFSPEELEDLWRER